MNQVEIIGWLATTLTLSSFIMKEMVILRTLNLFGALAWTCYGIAISNNPMIITNFVIILIHGGWIISLTMLKRNRNNK